MKLFIQLLLCSIVTGMASLSSAETSRCFVSNEQSADHSSANQPFRVRIYLADKEPDVQKIAKLSFIELLPKNESPLSRKPPVSDLAPQDDNSNGIGSYSLEDRGTIRVDERTPTFISVSVPGKFRVESPPSRDLSVFRIDAKTHKRIETWTIPELQARPNQECEAEFHLLLP